MMQSNFGTFTICKTIIFATMAQEVEHFLGKYLISQYKHQVNQGFSNIFNLTNYKVVKKV